jgi:hypothetical protein
MLRVFELFVSGWGHSAGNSMTLMMVCKAFPDRAIVFTAYESHVAAVKSLLGEDIPANLTIQAVPEPAGRVQWPGWRQAAYLFRTLQRVAPRSAAHKPEPWLILFGHPPIVRAVRWMMALRPEVTAQYQLHGELNTAFGWRSRNPLSRHFDLRACLSSTQADRERWLVLEPHIKDNLCRRIPSVTPAVEVLKYQLDMNEGSQVDEIKLQAPVRFFVMGIQTPDKGYPIYQALAEQVSRALPGRCAFHVCGIRRKELASISREGLVFDIDGDQLVDREIVLQAIADKHYIVLPYENGSWYDFSLSGVLHEAINFRKPIVALPTASISRLFAECGDIGYLCRSVDEMRDTIKRIVEAPDPERYARQQRNLEIARRQFAPEAVSGSYRAMTDRFLGSRWGNARASA